MLKRNLAYLCLFFSFFNGAVGQVSLQTGGANFSLPMFNWQDDKSRLVTSIGLTYNSGNGLRVNDVASNVGQGWNMLAGGVITRMQVGQPDDQYPSGTDNEYDVTRYPAGYLYATQDPKLGCPKALTKYPIFGDENRLYSQHNLLAEDKELDYFSFQFNGRAGMFVLDKPRTASASGDRYGVSLGDNRIEITFHEDVSQLFQNIRTTISSFTIKDVDGLIYRFSKLGLARVLRRSYCNAYQIEEEKQPDFHDLNVYHEKDFDNGVVTRPNIVSSWHLTEIEDPFTHRKVQFNYVDRYINSYAGADFSYNASLRRYAIVSYKYSISTSPVISSIAYPDGHQVLFNYGADRADLMGDKVLASVDIKYQSRYISKYQLNTTYFLKNRYGTPVEEYQRKQARLCLKSVKKIGIDLKDDSPPYIFDYYLGSSAADDYVPAPFSYRKDVWGYYNGNNSVDNEGNVIPGDLEVAQLSMAQVLGLCFINNSVPNNGLYLNPKQNYAKNGLLKQIIYPTGGTLSYKYEQNSGTLPGNSSPSMVGGVSVSQTSATDGGYSNGCSNPIVTNYNYVLDQPGRPSSLWALEMPINHTINMASHYAPEYKGWRYPFPGGWSLFGECFYHFMYPGILTRQQAISLTGFQQFMQTAAPYLGILSIISTIVDVVTVVGGSTGWGAIVAIVVDILAGVVTIAITCTKDYSKDTPFRVYYNYDLNAISPLPTQFKRIEVVEGDGNIGKTVHEFTNSDDYAIWFPGGPYDLSNPVEDPQMQIFPARQRFAAWAYGLPRFTTVYDKDGKKIKQTENQYDIFGYAVEAPGKNYIGTVTADLMSCKCQVANSSSQRSTDWNDPTKYNQDYISFPDADLKVFKYAMYTGRAELKTTFERTFKADDPTKFLQTQTSYTYNIFKNYAPYNYEVSLITTTQSNGDINRKYIKYNIDYTGGPLDILTSNNIFNLPVSTRMTVQKSGSYDENELSEKATEYLQLAGGDIKPYRTIEKRYSSPYFNSAHSSAIYYQGPGSDISTFNVTNTLSYDNAGNLLGINDEGGRSVANIYDYNDKYIVASVVNAQPATDQIGYTSFETSGLGNWTLANIAVYDATKSITGTRSLNLNGNTLTHALNTSTEYLLSFWATGTVSVSGSGVLVKSAPTIKGMTYYEYMLTAGASVVSLSGASIIDELRIYPKNARMKTTAYDPLFGKTAECDENNRIVYYEYDKLGRIQFVKDDAGNIVKMYEYNNVSAAKQNGCPALYYNNTVTEFFTRKNCSAGYKGGTYQYTVPANKYSSAISQDEADAFAESELLSSGPTAANQNGSCSLVYYNAATTVTKKSNGCPLGSYGGPVNYTVPANKYTSLISQSDANDKATEEINANIFTYVNDPANRNCIVTTEPFWTFPENGETECRTVGCVPHLFTKELDINPTSSTYNQIRWHDQGVSESCPLTQSCSFTAQSGSGIDISTSSISASGNSASFYIVFRSSSGNTNWSASNTIASINCPCRPSANRQITMSAGGGVWEIIIDTTGFVTVRLISGTGPSGTNLIGLNGSYLLN